MVNAINKAQKSSQQGMVEPLPSWTEATAELVDEYRNAAMTVYRRTNAAESLVASLPWVFFFGLGETVLFFVTMFEKTFFSRGDQAKNKVVSLHTFFLIWHLYVIHIYI